MYLFKNTVHQEQGDFSKIVLSGLSEVEIGPAQEFGGKAGLLSPEEMFVGAVNSCLMMTFFYFVRKADIEILSYHSDAGGRVKKGQDGFQFTGIEVNAKVQLEDERLAEQIRKFGDLAEKYCLISRSAACPVHYNLQIEIKEN